MTSAPLLSISLRGRTEFQVKARYVKDAVLDEVSSQNKQAAGLWEAIQRILTPPGTPGSS